MFYRLEDAVTCITAAQDMHSTNTAPLFSRLNCSPPYNECHDQSNNSNSTALQSFIGPSQPKAPERVHARIPSEIGMRVSSRGCISEQPLEGRGRSSALCSRPLLNVPWELKVKALGAADAQKEAQLVGGQWVRLAESLGSSVGE